MRERRRIPLTIAGSDPSGGAGLQADLKVFLRFGLSGAAVPTGFTVQAPSGVFEVHPLAPGLLKAQLDALLREVRPAAIKVGMLPDGEAVRAVARALSPLAGRIPIVVDPVLASSSGRRFLPPEEVGTFLRLLVPLATLFTPNAEETAELTGAPLAQVRRSPESVLPALLRTGARAVLIKGGHSGGQQALDVLGSKDDVVTTFSLPRVPRRRSVHGTGCALSAAITALIVQGASLEDAVGLAKEFVTAAIKAAQPMGRGARQLDFTVRLPEFGAADVSSRAE